MPSDPSLDDHVDREIAKCLTTEAPRSFFLYAGAGSGKTRSLVAAVRHGKTERGRELTVRGQQIAVITFTNAAVDEISSRLDFDPLVRVSTIHSFAWDLVREFQADIRDWVRRDLGETIADLKSKPSRAGSKKESERVHRLERAQNRVSYIDDIQRFTYNPAGENRESKALNHSQVISLTAHLLLSKPMLGQILVTRHPILFIDESQDTNKDLLGALMFVAANHEDEFILGLFGDTMQRIYTDGMTNIQKSVPDTWATPVKVMNHRSPERIVRLSNRIRSGIDDHAQEARADRGVGFARLFIAPATSDVEAVESTVVQEMATITGDPDWSTSLPGTVDLDHAASDGHSSDLPSVKRLILEHSMAARRLGFAKLFTALSALKSERTNLLDGSMPGLQVFVKQVVPLVEAHRRGNKFRVARTVREGSPLISKSVLENASFKDGALPNILEQCQTAVDKLTSLWDSNATPTIAEVAAVLDTTGLFVLTPSVRMALAVGGSPGSADPISSEIGAWQACLAVSFDEVVQYGKYINGASAFATHQGVKGLEFPRVMVVISDSEASGFMFSYETLLGAKPHSKTDAENRLTGKDNSPDRTRRLFYVTCSRATQSLAIIAYTREPDKVHDFAVDNGWFAADEIVLI